MSLKNITTLLIVSSLLFIQSCNYEFPSAPESTSADLGTADFTNVAVLGGKNSAGFMDGALYNEGQNHSYAALLSTLIEAEFGYNIYQPLFINSENGFNLEENKEHGGTPGKYTLSFRSETINYPVRVAQNGETISSFSGSLTDVNDYSIPNLYTNEWDDAAALQQNPFFSRITSKPAQSSLLDLVVNSNPSMIFFEPGYANIFNFALNGAVGVYEPDTDNYTNDDLIPIDAFDNHLTNAIDRLLNETTGDIFLFTIPDPLLMPYFDQLLWFYPFEEWDYVRDHLDFSHYSDFNVKVQQFNQTAAPQDYRPVIIYDNLGDDSFRSKVIIDDLMSDAQTSDGEEIPKYRQMTTRDYLLYSAETRHYESVTTTSSTFGTETPIDDRFVITASEERLINDRREAINGLLRRARDSFSRIHLIDFAEMIVEADEGRLNYDGVTFSLELDPTGIISADGYTLNQRGQALLANLIIESINDVYNATLPFIDVNSLRGNTFENGF